MVNSHNCGITTDTKSGAVFKHHVVLGAVTPMKPGEVMFSDVQKMTPAARLEAYKVGAARQKYDPLHGPRTGVTKILIDGQDDPAHALYTTAVDGGSPLSILIKSNDHLNKKGDDGLPIYHTADGVKHHVLEKPAYDSAMEVLEKHLKNTNAPVSSSIVLEAHTPNPPTQPYRITVSGHLLRGNFVNKDGDPTEPDEHEVPGKMLSGDSGVIESARDEIPGMPGMVGSFKAFDLASEKDGGD